MQEMEYTFKEFELLPDKNEGALFYSPETSAHLKSQSLIDMLKELKANKMDRILDSTLNRLIEKYNLQNTSIKEYLSNDLKVMALLEKDRFEKIFFGSNDAEISNILHESIPPRYGVKMLSWLDENLMDAKSLIVIFNNRYWPADFDKAYQLAKKHNAWVITAYIANHYLIIDNIYTAQKGVPCHFCNFNRHQNLVLSKNNLKKTSWINFTRRAMAEDVTALPGIRFTPVERGLVAFWLTKMIKNFISPHGMTMTVQDVTCYTVVNLMTGEMNKEQAVHWLVCQCRNEDA